MLFLSCPRFFLVAEGVKWRVDCAYGRVIADDGGEIRGIRYVVDARVLEGERVKRIAMGMRMEVGMGSLGCGLWRLHRLR